MKKYDETNGFKAFWSIWPKKQARIDAVKAWHQMGCEELTGKICRAVHAHKDHVWQGSDRKFIPLPATWLRQGRWEDEVHVPRALGALAKRQPTVDPGPELPPFGALANRVMFPYLQNRILKQGWVFTEDCMAELLQIKERFRAAVERDQPSPERSARYLNHFYAECDKAYERSGSPKMDVIRLPKRADTQRSAA